MAAVRPSQALSVSVIVIPEIGLEQALSSFGDLENARY
jgi:hypothetical protein